MKNILITILLVTILLIGSGCAQESKIQSGYEIKSTSQGVVVQMSREKYNFKDDAKCVWNDEDKQFRNHTIFWTTICVYPFFGMPFTETPTYIFTIL